MSKLDLSRYSDKEILTALLNLPAKKYYPLIEGISAFANKAEKRGKSISDSTSDEAIEEMLRKWHEEESE